MFRFNNAAKKYFSNITDGRNFLIFDAYLSCALYGMKRGLYESVGNDVDPFIDDYPAVFKDKRFKIFALLSLHTAHYLKIDLKKYEEVKAFIEKMHDKDKGCLLSQDAVNYLNGFANGGFSELISATPYDTVEEFLVEYQKKMFEL